MIKMVAPSRAPLVPLLFPLLIWCSLLWTRQDRKEHVSFVLLVSVCTYSWYNPSEERITLLFLVRREREIVTTRPIRT